MDNILENLEINPGSNVQLVSNYYNSLATKVLEETLESKILALRNFHYRIKHDLITKTLREIRSTKLGPLYVFDMCCGKGGDLQKFLDAHVEKLICVDNSEVSLKACEKRLGNLKNNFTSVEFFKADLSKEFVDFNLEVDMTNCQFAFHYFFESFHQADCAMRNVTKNLRTGGFFVGTVSDSEEILLRACEAQSKSFGNGIHQIELECDWRDPPPFGGKYHVWIDQHVNCPEFLVDFDVLVQLAGKYGLELVRKTKFVEYYERMKCKNSRLSQDELEISCESHYFTYWNHNFHSCWNRVDVVLFYRSLFIFRLPKDQ